MCELSTALAKAELETKVKEEEVGEEIKKWEKTGEMPTPEVLGRLIVSQNEVSKTKCFLFWHSLLFSEFYNFNCHFTIDDCQFFIHT